MKFICLFCPAFISVFLELKREGKKDYLDIVIHYFLSVLAINLLMFLISVVIFNLNSYLFTISFSIKYIILSSFIAFCVPYFKYGMVYLYHNKKDICKNPNKYLEKLKKPFLKNKNNIFKFIFLITIFANFIMLDLFVRTKSYNAVSFYNINELAPNLFSLLYILLIAVIVYNLPKIIGKIVLGIWYVIFFVLFIINYMLIAIKNNAFTFYDLTNASEGAAYLNFLLKEINLKLILVALFSIILIVVSFICLNKIQKNSLRWLKIGSVAVAVICMIFGHSYAINSLGSYEDNDFTKHVKPRYHYDNYTNSNRALQVSGLYEYSFRDLYLYIKRINESVGSKEDIDKLLSQIKVETSDNDKTGIFKDKNLIMIMLESIDNMVINKENMPTLNYMKENGWSFSGRNSNNISTLATEYTSLSGLFFSEDSYTINNNNYIYSLPNVMNRNNYITSSVHENKGIYYNRQQLHKSLGFQNSYFLYDILDNPLHGNDEQIVKNDEIYNKIVSKDKKFMTSIITISAHGPYVNNYYCLAENIDSGNSKECISYLSGLTDDMLKTLLTRLEEDGILDDTVIVLYSDHYPYAYSFSENELAGINNIDGNYKVRNLPFIIYNSELTPKEYDMLFSDIDIVPTLLNLFDIDFNSKNYIGTDIFSKEHKNINILTDYSWYDGNIYSMNATEFDDYYNETSKYVQNVLDLNKMMLNNNYYGAE